MDRFGRRRMAALGDTPNLAADLSTICAAGDRVRGKDYNIGLRGGLIDQRHCVRMGSAIWLYAWSILRQGHQQDDIGWVPSGSPVTYREIEKEAGFNSRTIKRCMLTWRCKGYIRTQPVAAGIVVRKRRNPHDFHRGSENLRSDSAKSRTEVGNSRSVSPLTPIRIRKVHWI